MARTNTRISASWSALRFCSSPTPWSEPPVRRRLAAEALGQEIEEYAHLGHLLRAWREHSVCRRPLRIVLVGEQGDEPAVAQRPRHQVVAEARDAGALQSQLQDAFLVVAGENAGNIQML